MTAIDNAPDRPTDPDGVTKSAKAKETLFKVFSDAFRNKTQEFGMTRGMHSEFLIGSSLQEAVRVTYHLEWNQIQGTTFRDTVMSLHRTYSAAQHIAEIFYKGEGADFHRLFDSITEPLRYYVEGSIFNWIPKFDESTGLGIRTTE